MFRNNLIWASASAGRKIEVLSFAHAGKMESWNQAYWAVSI